MERADGNTNISYLISKVREFLEERDWKKYHNPKDLAESICIEAAELLQLFQWTRPEESEQFKSKPSEVQRIKEELADVGIYCLSMADTLNIDLTSAILDKLGQNKKKYPVEFYKGKAFLTS
ncbi:nucleotide pyrophosphohydrolase [Candidatus Bathyarchaeota archaeon]|nr:MAG: nucleotide pyrophosphohydrolase [Candidatus Bathyarchaeota archaeon]